MTERGAGPLGMLKMQTRICWGMAVGGLAGVIVATGLLGWGQYGQPGGGVPTQGPIGTRSQGALTEGTDVDPVFAEKRARALNADRHKSMVSDTDKLLRLARQLDAEIASKPTEELTPEEMQKVAEIEKLAHNVKTKMSQSFSGGPEIHPLSIGAGGRGID